MTHSLLSAGELAALCEVDTKTVQNWCARGLLPHFKSPGGHLRFTGAAVVAFLQEGGYVVPDTLLRRSPSLLLVAPEADRERAKTALGPSVVLIPCGHPYDVLLRLDGGRAALFVEAAAEGVDLAPVMEAIHRARPQMPIGLVGTCEAPPYVLRGGGLAELAHALIRMAPDEPTPRRRKPKAGPQGGDPAGGGGESVPPPSGELPPHSTLPPSAPDPDAPPPPSLRHFEDPDGEDL